MTEVWIWEYDNDDYYSSGALLMEDVCYTTRDAAKRAAQVHATEVHTNSWGEEDHELVWYEGVAKTRRGIWSVSNLEVRE